MKVLRGRDFITGCRSEANLLSDRFFFFNSQPKYAHLRTDVRDKALERNLSSLVLINDLLLLQAELACLQSYTYSQTN